MLNLADLLRVPQVDTGLRFDISPDGQKVAFSWNKTGNWEIHTMSLRGAAKRRRSNLKEGMRNYFSKIVVTSRGDGAKFAPQYSPDGTQLAYACDLEGSESYHIVLHNLKNDSSVDLTSNSAPLFFS